MHSPRDRLDPYRRKTTLNGKPRPPVDLGCSKCGGTGPVRQIGVGGWHPNPCTCGHGKRKKSA